MNCPPVKSIEVQNQLCGLLYYPGKCSSACNRMYKRWLTEYEEVRRLEDFESEPIPQARQIKKFKLKARKNYSN